MDCIWFKSLDYGYTWTLLNTTLLFQLHRRSLLWSHCCWTELIYKPAAVTFNNAHIARAINTRCRLMQTKRKRRKIPSSAQSAYMTKWKLKHTDRTKLIWAFRDLTKVLKNSLYGVSNNYAMGIINWWESKIQHSEWWKMASFMLRLFYPSGNKLPVSVEQSVRWVNPMSCLWYQNTHCHT